MHGLSYCHEQGVAHRDLKLENLLLDKDFRLKIADFGLSGPINGRQGKGYLYTVLGTEGLFAPEMLAGEPYKGEEVDLFAMGVSLFAMVAGFPPFNCADMRADLFYKALIRRPEVYWRKITERRNGRGFSPEFKDLMAKMLEPEATARLTMQQVLSHEWMQGPDLDENEVQLTMKRLMKVKNERMAGNHGEAHQDEHIGNDR